MDLYHRTLDAHVDIYVNTMPEFIMKELPNPTV